MADHTQLWSQLSLPSSTGHGGQDWFFLCLSQVPDSVFSAKSVPFIQNIIATEMDLIPVQERGRYELRTGLSWLEWGEGVRSKSRVDALVLTIVSKILGSAVAIWIPGTCQPTCYHW
eukprot:63438-Rhodomonas_salina.1